jgi:hypothetical protein
MQASENARLHAMNVLWANISHQQKTNVQIMNKQWASRVEALLLNWFLFTKVLQ